jgi:methyltransferase (TIGR00027 family)
MKAKYERILKLFGEVPGNVRLISVDFDRQDLQAVLEKSDFTQGKKTFFLWEAVTQYLKETGIRATFDFLAKSVSGSQLIFTYVRKDFLDGEKMYGWEKGYEKYVLKDNLWHFGMNPDGWPDFLKDYGWRVVEDLGYDELADRYVSPTGRQLATMLIERILLAEKV